MQKLSILLAFLLLSGCTNSSINSANRTSTGTIQITQKENLDIDSFTEYPFEKCGTRDKFQNYNWYPNLVQKISTIEVANNYLEEKPIPAKEQDIAEICFSETANRAIIIVHPPALLPNNDRNQEWKIAKFIPEANKLILATKSQKYYKYADSVEFGKREKNIIIIHTLDRWATMYNKTEYSYNYIENTIERKITCNYDDREPDQVNCN